MGKLVTGLPGQTKTQFVVSDPPFNVALPPVPNGSVFVGCGDNALSNQVMNFQAIKAALEHLLLDLPVIPITTAGNQTTSIVIDQGAGKEAIRAAVSTNGADIVPGAGLTCGFKLLGTETYSQMNGPLFRAGMMGLSVLLEQRGKITLP